MVSAVIDTHALIWYLASDARLSARAKNFIEETAFQGQQIALSSITLAEMVYLIERGRISASQFSLLAESLNTPTSLFLESPLNLAIVRLMSQVDAIQIPEMPDRIIATTGLYYGVPVISRDSKIALSSIKTIW